MEKLETFKIFNMLLAAGKDNNPQLLNEMIKTFDSAEFLESYIKYIVEELIEIDKDSILRSANFLIENSLDEVLSTTGQALANYNK